MPIETDPVANFEISLPRHEDMPRDDRPCFLFRYPKRIEAKRLHKAIGAIRRWNNTTRIDEVDDVLQGLVDALKACLVDWRNQCDPDGKAVEFDAERFEEIVDESDLFTLANRVRASSILRFEDKKKSESASASSTDTTAVNAEAPAEPAS